VILNFSASWARRQPRSPWMPALLIADVAIDDGRINQPPVAEREAIMCRPRRGASC
jgi:hypothetical protein